MSESPEGRSRQPDRAKIEDHRLVTAEGAGELAADMTMVLDGYTAFEHSLPVRLQNDIVQLVAKSGTFYTPTLLVSYGGPLGELYYWQTMNPHEDPKLNRFVPHLTLDPMARRHPMIALDEYHFPVVARGVAQVVRAGGNASLGAHGQLQGLGAHWELWAMAGEGGGKESGAMTPMEALRSATINAADKIGFAPDLGSIEKGKLADFIVLDADPLADIHNTTKIRWVIKNGEVYDAESMRQEWPVQRDLPRAFWKMGGVGGLADRLRLKGARIASLVRGVDKRCFLCPIGCIVSDRTYEILDTEGTTT